MNEMQEWLIVVFVVAGSIAVLTGFSRIIQASRFSRHNRQQHIESLFDNEEDVNNDTKD